LKDLRDIDPALANGLQSICEMAEAGEDISLLGLKFEAVVDFFGGPRSVPFIEGMSGVSVDHGNVRLYVAAYVDFLLDKLIHERFLAFKRGFALVTHIRSLKLLQPEEMDILVSGEETMDLAALRTFACYADGYSEDAQAIRWFWEIFDEFTREEQLLFLKFATGTDRSPLGGLGKMKLVIQRGADPDRLPVAHTCFNSFTLPDYRSKIEMRNGILRAICETEGFGLE
jgi:hypothetical protein